MRVVSKYICFQLDISCPLDFLEKFWSTASRTVRKSDFCSYYIKRQSLNLPEKVASNHNVCDRC